MSIARRPLLTAIAAGTLLCALWFVPSANATSEQEAAPRQQSGIGATSEELTLADTGSVNTTPYLIGGMGFLGIGAGFMAYSVRKSGALLPL